MIDPLAEVVTLLQPSSPSAKVVGGAGAWRVRRSEPGRPFHCIVLEGRCRLAVDGLAPITLVAGDFVLVPAASVFTMSSADADPDDAPDDADPDAPPVALPDGEFRLGRPDGPPEARWLVGYCRFGSPDAGLLVPLLPRLVHVRGDDRLGALVRLVADECRARRPAREVVLARLLEVLLIEALRSTDGPGHGEAPGLLRALSDERLAAALRRLHEQPAHPWTVPLLAKEAALSRSAFFDRFSRTVGMPPMAYLLAWRMANARRLLREGGLGMAEIAERVGYASASAFGVAFARHAGTTPARYAREAAVSGTAPASAPAPR